jgi:hypothetical protein
MNGLKKDVLSKRSKSLPFTICERKRDRDSLRASAYFFSIHVVSGCP